MLLLLDELCRFMTADSRYSARAHGSSRTRRVLGGQSGGMLARMLGWIAQDEAQRRALTGPGPTRSLAMAYATSHLREPRAA